MWGIQHVKELIGIFLLSVRTIMDVVSMDMSIISYNTCLIDSIHIYIYKQTYVLQKYTHICDYICVTRSIWNNFFATLFRLCIRRLCKRNVPMLAQFHPHPRPQTIAANADFPAELGNPTRSSAPGQSNQNFAALHKAQRGDWEARVIHISDISIRFY